MWLHLFIVQYYYCKYMKYYNKNDEFLLNNKIRFL